MKSFSALTLAGMVLGAAGAITVIAGAVVLTGRIQVVQSWPLVEARVVESIGKYPPDTPSPEAHYQFSYRVNNQDYLTRFVSRGTVDQVRDRVVAHATAIDCTLRYNPSNPGEIAPNLDFNSATLGSAVSIAGAGVSLLLLGAALAIFGIRTQDRF